MQIKYKFATGEEMVVEVSDDIGNIILETRRAEHAENVRQGYHTACSFDDMDFEGCIFASTDSEPARKLIRKEKEAECEERLSHLTPVQRRRYEMFAGDGMTVAEIARSEKASFNSVKESIEAARQKLKKYL